MISAEEARSAIRKAADRYAATFDEKEPESVALERSLGRRLAKNVEAQESLPGFDNSAMDGYALRSTETLGATVDRPLPLNLRGKQSAGLVQARAESVESGTCVAVMTGAPIPKGADAVVPVEDVEVRDSVVYVRSPIAAGRHVRFQGEDVRPGAPLYSKGHVLRSVDLGVLSSQGFATVAVAPKLRVGFFSTGDELIEASGVPKESQIRDASGPIIRSLLEEWGCQVENLGFVPDTKTDLESAMKRAHASNDLVIFTGGVSMGEWDFGPENLKKLGAEVVFHKTNVKPGKPLLFATWENKLVFGLPGNPVSSLVTFLAFAQEALERLCGPLRRWKSRAVAGSPLRKSKDSSQTVFLRVRRDSLFPDQVHALEQQGSHMLGSLAQTYGFVELASDVPNVGLGQSVKFYPV